jgi:hypothetical protein
VAAAAPETGAGVRIKGKLVNATAVVHESLVFGVRVKGRTATSTATLNVARAAPGVAVPFEIALPGVPLAESTRAFIELRSSTISYASTSGKTPSSREPFDPEKILRGGD